MEKRIVRSWAMAAVVFALACVIGVSGCSQPAQSSQASQSGSGSATSSMSASAAGPVLENRPVIKDENFGSVEIDISIEDFNALGFEFGDSIDIVFSNGYELRGIPYFNGYYASAGSPLLVGYPGSPRIKAAVNYGDSLWETAGMAEGDTATITLVEKDVFQDVQDAFDIAYTNERSDYGSDAEFANYRMLTGGKTKEGVLFRSASPVFDSYNRASYVNDLMEVDGVQVVLNLSDSKEEVDEFLAKSREKGANVAYFTKLNDAGKVLALGMAASYQGDVFHKKLAGGLIELSGYEGPYLVHCIEGKDRTGFVCALLEGLMGATYQEIVDDYMVTYKNYYGITEQSDPAKYQAIKALNIDAMLRYLAKAGADADLSTIDYTEPARNYLRDGGMTDEQIDALIARIGA